MQIDAGAVVTNIAGVETQGRHDTGQWVTTYKLDYSLNGIDFHPVDGGNTFAANNDRSTKVKRYPPKPLSAIRSILPQTWHGYPSMRRATVGTTRKSTRKLFGRDNADSAHQRGRRLPYLLRPCGESQRFNATPPLT